MAALARREQRSTNIWPGFVDALATLLMVIMFLLMVFVLAQFFLGEALSGRDQALKKLEFRVGELADLLALERASNDDLRGNLAQLSQELQVSVALRDDLKGTVSRLREEGAKTQGELNAALGIIDENQKTIAEQRSELGLLGQDLAALEALKAELEAEIVDVALRLDRAKQTLAETEKDLAGSKTKLAGAEQDLTSTKSKLTGTEQDLASTKSKLAGTEQDLASTKTELAGTERDLAARSTALDETKAELNKRLDELGVTKADLAKRLLELAETRNKLADRTMELGDTRSRLGETETKLESTWEELAQALKQNKQTAEVLSGEKTLSEKRRQNLERMKLSLFDEEELSRKTRAQIALLNRQLAALKNQLAVLSGALDLAAKKSIKQNVQIQSLGKRLNAALASKVQELSRYRSEFFGRLRDVLGQQVGVRTVGDRFVFQSEVLFAKGAAELGTAGQQRLDRLATTLIDLAGRIPKDIDWVLRVDGHSDTDPIATARFPSNWHLSSARAISVVQHLVAAGLPPRRLMAAGFGQFAPIASGASEDAKARNRRIEFKLTQP